MLLANQKFKKKKKLSDRRGKMLLPHLRKWLSEQSDLGLGMTLHTHPNPFQKSAALSIPPSYLSVHTIL